MKVRVNLNSPNGTSFHTFPLVQKAHVMSRDDAIHLVGRLVTSIAQTWRMILLDDEQVEKSGRFQS